MTWRWVGLGAALITALVVAVVAVVPSQAGDTVGALVAGTWDCELDERDDEDETMEWSIEVDEGGDLAIEAQDGDRDGESFDGEWSFADGRLRARFDDFDPALEGRVDTDRIRYGGEGGDLRAADPQDPLVDVGEDFSEITLSWEAESDEDERMLTCGRAP